MKTKLFLIAVVSLLLLLTASAAWGQAGGPGGGDGCTDAAGGSIPCPDDGGGDGGGDTSEPGGSGDRDGDGTPDGSDRCPDAGGPASLAGCPDNDGDGTPDIDDRCPAEGGPDSNGGCPVEEGESTTDTGESTTDTGGDTGAAILPPLPADGECVIGTLRDAAVNVRQYPSLDAAVVGSIQPGQTYAVLHIWIGPDGTWYRIGNPAGWVSGLVVQTGGDCSGVATSDFGDPASAQGAVPHWGPNGELWFCLPDYEMGEETCVPNPDTAGAVPNWGPNGELWFCLPDYEMGEETCVVFPADATPHWTIDDIVWCIPDETGEEQCFVLETDEHDGGTIIRYVPGSTGAPPEEPKWHKFLLVGDDGLLVLTAPQPDDGTAAGPGGEFPLWLALCPPDEEDECLFQLHSMYVPDFPIAGCAFNPDAIIQCSTGDPAGDAGTPGHVKVFDGTTLMYMHFAPDFPIAGCAFDPDAIIQCSTGDPAGSPYQPEDLPFAACAFNPDLIIQCDPDGMNANQYTPDLPLAACAFNPDALIQCGTGEPRQTREHILLARQVGGPAVGVDVDPDGTVHIDPNAPSQQYPG